MSKTGNLGRLYHNTGTMASPVQVECKRVKDLSTPLTKGEVDVSRRESTWELVKGSLKKGSVEFGYQYKAGTDTFFSAMVDSFVNGTPMLMSAVDGNITVAGTFGFTGAFEVMELPIDQPLKDGMTLAVVMKPTDAEEAAALIEPELITISA